MSTADDATFCMRWSACLPKEEGPASGVNGRAAALPPGAIAAPAGLPTLLGARGAPGLREGRELKARQPSAEQDAGRIAPPGGERCAETGQRHGLRGAAGGEACEEGAPCRLPVLPVSALSWPCHAQESGQGRIEVGRRLNVDSSEKDIYDGLYDGRACVLCFPKPSNDRLEREARVLGLLDGCRHVIGLMAFVREPQCMVVERVEPLGYDLIEVITQLAHSGRCMPLGQVRYYVLQLTLALEEWERRGVVHRDLKPDNVLVDRDHTVKVIDCGCATAPGLDAPRVANEYHAPEANRDPWSPSIDLWSVGMIIYSLCVGQNPTREQALRWAKSHGGVAGALEGLLPDAVEAIDGLLRVKPEKRWSLAQLRRWATRAQLPPAVAPGGGALQRWPYRDNCPQAFGAQLPPCWARSGQTIGDLELMRIGGLQVLLVDRFSEWRTFYAFSDGKVRIAYRNLRNHVTRWQPPPCDPRTSGVVVNPAASTVLREKDWIYFGVNSSVGTDALADVILERLELTKVDGDLGSLARCASQATLVQFMPEFLFFEFPPHCFNAVLGDRSRAEAGQNALNLRNVFQISVAGIAHLDGTVSWWPGAGEAGGGLVSRGDRGLIMRVPQWDASISIRPAVQAQDVDDLLDLRQFRTRLGLDSTAAWDAWQRDAGLQGHSPER